MQSSNTAASFHSPCFHRSRSLKPDIKKTKENLPNSSTLCLRFDLKHATLLLNSLIPVRAISHQQTLPSHKINRCCRVTPWTFILSTSKKPRHPVPAALWFSLPSPFDREQALSHCVKRDKILDICAEHAVP